MRGVEGSDGSAAGGGCSDLSEWPRSTDEEGFLKPTKMSGTATGRLVGAVTHVHVRDPTMGYGIFIGNMLNAAAQKHDRGKMPLSFFVICDIMLS